MRAERRVKHTHQYLVGTPLPFDNLYEVSHTDGAYGRAVRCVGKMDTDASIDTSDAYRSVFRWDIPRVITPVKHKDMYSSL